MIIQKPGTFSNIVSEKYNRYYVIVDPLLDSLLDTKLYSHQDRIHTVDGTSLYNAIIRVFVHRYDFNAPYGCHGINAGSWEGPDAMGVGHMFYNTDSIKKWPKIPHKYLMSFAEAVRAPIGKKRRARQFYQTVYCWAGEDRDEIDRLYKASV